MYFILNAAFTYWIWGVERGTIFSGFTKSGEKVSSNPISQKTRMNYQADLSLLLRFACLPQPISTHPSTSSPSPSPRALAGRPRPLTSPLHFPPGSRPTVSSSLSRSSSGSLVTYRPSVPRIRIMSLRKSGGVLGRARSCSHRAFR